MDARIHIFNFAPKNFKIINVRQVLVSATAEYKMEDLDPMQWTMQKIKFCLVTWSQIMSCGVLQVIPEKNIMMTHYRDSLDGSKIQRESLILCRLATAVGFQ